VTTRVDALFATPDHYLYAFEAGEALFLPVDRDVYRRSLFLDDRIALESGEILPFSAEALAARRDAEDRPIPRIGWIFHIAHCGSTLLARALDRGDETLVLREPLPLRQLGVEGAGLVREPRPAAWAARLRLAVALDPAAPGILLHHPLDAYLLAILRSDTHREWVMRVTGEIAPGIEAWAGPIAGLDVVERAAALWLAQMRIYDAALGRHPDLHSLAAAALFDQPRAVLTAAFALFGVAVAPAAIDDIVTGPLFATHAKNPDRPFDNAARREREARLGDLLRTDLDRARRWITARCGAYPIPDRLARPLVGEGVALLDENRMP